MSARIFLLIVSLLSGILWRVELEYRWGWADLHWLSADYYYSTLAMAGLFGLWILVFADCRKSLRISLALVAVVFAQIAYFVFKFSGSIFYARFSTGIFVLIPIIMVCIVIPGVIVTVGYLFNPNFSALHCLLALAVYFLAPFLASVLLEVVHHRGGSDWIHTAKSGFIFPFLVFACGIPFLRFKSTDSKTGILRD